MIAKVTKKGVLIPAELLDGAKTVEIRKVNEQVVIGPCRDETDPVYKLGKNPVEGKVTDGARNLDKYLYGK